MIMFSAVTLSTWLASYVFVRLQMPEGRVFASFMLALQHLFPLSLYCTKKKEMHEICTNLVSLSLTKSVGIDVETEDCISYADI